MSAYLSGMDPFLTREELLNLLCVCTPLMGERGNRIQFFLHAWKWAGAPESGSVSSFCAVAFAWAKQHDTPEHGYRQIVELDMGKSNLLYRMLYKQQRLRTVPCPTHKGEWGITWETTTEHGLPRCAHGCGFTGWLPCPA